MNKIQKQDPTLNVVCMHVFVQVTMKPIVMHHVVIVSIPFSFWSEKMAHFLLLIT